MDMTKEEIERRIKDEYRKHRDLDWAKIASKKIFSSLNQTIKENYKIGYNHASLKTKELEHKLKAQMYNITTQSGEQLNIVEWEDIERIINTK